MLDANFCLLVSKILLFILLTGYLYTNDVNLRNHILSCFRKSQPLYHRFSSSYTIISWIYMCSLFIHSVSWILTTDSRLPTLDSWLSSPYSLIPASLIKSLLILNPKLNPRPLESLIPCILKFICPLKYWLNKSVNLLY